MERGRTYYSQEIKGDRRNYNWPVTYDVTDGYLGITQIEGGKVRDRVLLSPKQVNELTQFLTERAAPIRKRRAA